MSALTLDISLFRKPPRVTPAGKSRGAFRDAASVAVRELMHHSLALRHARPAFLAWVCRPFFLAGWNASDIKHAIDNRPDSTRIPHDAPHDAPHGVAPENLARWAQERLSHWLTADGTPLPSRDQRLEADRRQKRAQAQAAAVRHAERQAQAAAPAQPISEEKARALDAIRALRK